MYLDPEDFSRAHNVVGVIRLLDRAHNAYSIADVRPPLGGELLIADDKHGRADQRSGGAPEAFAALDTVVKSTILLANFFLPFRRCIPCNRHSEEDTRDS